jgi:hypothetical protein
MRESPNSWQIGTRFFINNPKISSQKGCLPSRKNGRGDILFCCHATDSIFSAHPTVKGWIERVEILAVQMLLRPTKGVAKPTISNKCRFALWDKAFFILQCF